MDVLQPVECLSAAYNVYYSPTMTLKDKTKWGKKLKQKRFSVNKNTTFWLTEESSFLREAVLYTS